MNPIPASLRFVERRVLAGRRLLCADGKRLEACGDLHALGLLANIVRERRHGPEASWVANAHLNYTNVCRNACRFCAFGRKKGDPLAWEMSVPEIARRAADAAASGATELHVTGGLHPDRPYAWYPRILRAIRRAAPRIRIKAIPAVEILHAARIGRRTARAVLEDFRAAGLDALTGGGADIFAPRVRRRICPAKPSAAAWLDVHRTAHRLGIPTTATMLFGHVESAADRVDHLLRVRALQDETGGFEAFVPLPFVPARTALSRIPKPTARAILREIAVSRLMLDNVDRIVAYWPMTGVDVASVALWYGADDLHGTVCGERIAHMAGADTPAGLPGAELERIIRAAGRSPVRRES